MHPQLRGILWIILTVLLLVGTSVPAFAAGGIPGISSFKGGDGSFDRVVREGIVIAISNDPPYTYQDEKTKEFDGVDVRILRMVTKLLGIQKVRWEIVQFDTMIPGLIAKRWDVVGDNIHENEKRLPVIDFTSPSFWYGTALAVQKGNPKNIHTSADLAGKVVGVVRGAFQHGLLEKRTDIKELKMYTSTETELADLMAGRIDVTMDDDIKISLFLKNHPNVPIEFASGYSPALEEYGYARYGLRKQDVDLNHAISRALEELRANRDGIPKLLEEAGFSLRNMWYWPACGK